MSKQFKDIDFDHFKSQFEEQSSQDLGWNDPPDFVFDEAIAVVNGQKKLENKKNLFILLSLMLVGVVVGFLLLSHYKVSTLEERVNLLTVDSLNSDVSNLSKGNQAEAKSLTDVNKDSNNKEEDIKNESFIVAQDVNADKKLITKTTAGNNAVMPSQNFTLSKEPLFLSQELSSDDVTIKRISRISKAVEGSRENFATISKEAITPIDQLAVAINGLESNREIFNLNKTTTWIEATQRPKASINFAAIRNFSSFAMNGEFNSPQLLTEYDDFYTGLGYQVGLELPVSSKLSWVNSLAFNRINNESYNVNSGRYLKSNEFNTGGSTVYIMDMNVESPVGLLSETMAIEVDSTLMEDGDVIEDKVNIGQRLNVFSLATGFQYSVFQNKNIDWYTGVSLGGAYVSRLTTEMESEIVMNNKTMDSFSITMENSKDFNAFYSFLELSSGVGYSLNKKYKLNMGLGYSRSLNSLRSNTQGGPSTYLQNWSTTLGLSRSF